MATIEVETKDITEPRKFVTLRLTETEAQEIKYALYRSPMCSDPEELLQSDLYKLIRDALDGKPHARVIPQPKRKGFFF